MQTSEVVLEVPARAGSYSVFRLDGAWLLQSKLRDSSHKLATAGG
jgi:hypothetical protein